MSGKDRFGSREKEEEQNEGPLPYTEKRKHPRYLVQQPIEYHHPGSTAIHYGHTINLSESGLEVACPEQMDPEKQFDVEIYFSSGIRVAAIQAKVQVIWAEDQARDDGFYHFGAMIANISPRDIVRLRCFLKQFLH